MGATTTSVTSKGSASTSSSLDGTWNVGTGSIAGYRVQEVLLGQSATAVGRTSKIWGSLTIAASTVTKGNFTVDMASVVSDQSQRNAHFDGPIMDVSQYPAATLTLTSPIALGSIPANGVVQRYDATGALDMDGTTRTVSFTVCRAERESDRRPGGYHDPLLGMEHLEPQHRRIRDDGGQWHVGGPLASHAG
jgi:polyisoprenoid-binding protein YceI